MKSISFILFLIVNISVFSQTKAEKELLKIDENFAKISRNQSAKAAFAKYLAEKTEFIMDNQLPMNDRQIIIDFFSASKYSYWIPKKAVVSKSGELGYTYGISKSIYNDGSKDITEYYQYVSIWQKNEKGEWKMISDSGHRYPKEEAEKIFK